MWIKPLAHQLIEEENITFFPDRVGLGKVFY